MSASGEDGNQPARDSLDGLPSFTSYYLGPDGRPVDPGLLYHQFVCEECETLKADVIEYTLPTMVLIPRAIWWDEMAKCRRCMRRHIHLRLWLAALLSHVFSPVIVAWWLWVYAETFYRKPA